MAGESSVAPNGPQLTAAPPSSLPDEPGTYALVLHLGHTSRLVVGALGPQIFPVGCYVYVGSAWGPGGLRARVERHLRGSERTHWHIDVLRRIATPIALWLSPQKHLECIWARYLAAQPGVAMPVSRFGASDCRCPSHLFLLSREPGTLQLPHQPDFLPLNQSPVCPLKTKLA